MFKFLKNTKGICALVLVAVLAVMPAVAQAQEAVELPNIGIDVAESVKAFGALLGSYIASVFVLSLAFIGVRRGLQWIRGQAR